MIPIYNIADFPTVRSIDNQFMLERFEDLNRPTNLKWPHKHSFFEILWLTSGKSTNVIDYHQVTVEPNTLFFIYPGQLHLMSKAENVKGFSLAFNEDFLLLNASNKEMLLELTFLDKSSHGPVLNMDVDSIDELTPILHVMLMEIERKDKSKSIISQLLLVLLEKIQRIVNTNQNLSYEVGVIKKYKKFRHLIEHHFKTEKSLNFYGSELGLSPHTLNEISKTVTGRTAGSILRDRILLETKRLLIHSEYSIGQISDQLGFKDFAYFSRQFKKYEGLTPASYRKQLYQKYQTLQEIF